jgi:hypothetical protein
VALSKETLGFAAQAVVIFVRRFSPLISYTNRSMSVKMSRNGTFLSSGSQYCILAQLNV